MDASSAGTAQSAYRNFPFQPSKGHSSPLELAPPASLSLSVDEVKEDEVKELDEVKEHRDEVKELDAPSAKMRSMRASFTPVVLRPLRRASSNNSDLSQAR